MVYYNKGAVERAPMTRASSKGRAFIKAPIIKARINKGADLKGEH